MVVIGCGLSIILGSHTRNPDTSVPPVYRTDLLGEIRITTDGVSLWAESDNGEPEQLL